MKMKILCFTVLGTFCLTSQAAIIECQRAIEVEDKPFVYRKAPAIQTRIPLIRLNTDSGAVTYTRQLEGRTEKKTETFKVVPPNEEFENYSVVFKTDVGESILNSSQPERGRYWGSQKRYVIAEFFEGDIDANAWTYLCPLHLKGLLQLD